MIHFPEVADILNDGEALRIENYPRPSNDSSLNELSSQGIMLYRRLEISEMNSFITPTPNFFIRNHLKYPDIDKYKWRLRLDGLFEEKVALTLDQLKQFPMVSKVTAIECTGNQHYVRKITDSIRILLKYTDLLNINKLAKLFDPLQLKWAISLFKSTGIRGGNLISNGIFTGVRLFDILEKYKIQKNVKEIVFEGMDTGHDTAVQRIRKDAIHFARSFELDELHQYDPILCYEMNGSPLTLEHGYPLRLIIPGMYGAEQVKWLGRIIATDEKHRGYYQTEYYGYKIDGETIPVHEMRPKSMVIKVLRKNGKITAYGLAWRGRSPIEKILVSTDDMKTWQGSDILYKEIENSWLFWKYELPDHASGSITIVPRAFCENGDCQPLKPGKYSTAYGNNSVISATFSA